MRYCIAVIIAFICSIVAYAALDIKIAKRVSLFHIVSLEEYKEAQLEPKKIYIVTAVIFLISLMTALSILQSITEPLNIVKMFTALVMLVGSACFDYREKRIPNIFPLILSVSGIVLLILGHILQQNGAMSYVISSTFATVGCAICLTVASALTKQGIGAGDIKLMSALAIVGGVHMICGVLFFSVVSCSIAALYFIITKKKSLKETVPFGPFIFLGFVISVFTSMY